MEMLSSELIGSISKQQDKLCHYSVFSFNSLCQVNLSLELQRRKLLPAPVHRVVHVTYRPGSKAFTTCMYTHTLLDISSIFTVSDHPDEGTSTVNRNEVREVFPPHLLSSVKQYS